MIETKYSWKCCTIHCLLYALDLSSFNFDFNPYKKGGILISMPMAIMVKMCLLWPRAHKEVLELLLTVFSQYEQPSTI